MGNVTVTVVLNDGTDAGLRPLVFPAGVKSSTVREEIATLNP